MEATTQCELGSDSTTLLVGLLGGPDLGTVPQNQRGGIRIRSQREDSSSQKTTGLPLLKSPSTALLHWPLS